MKRTIDSVDDSAAMPDKKPTRIPVISTVPALHFFSDKESSVLVIGSILDEAERAAFAAASEKVERASGRSGYGMKPRAEVCYTPTGESYVYSRIAHKTTKFPPHVMALVPKLLAAVRTLVPDNEFECLSNAVDIRYSADFKFGGSISWHSDDEEDWGLVLIYNLGQTRYLYVRDKLTRETVAVPLADTTLVAMHGANCQRNTEHSVPKLPPSADVGTRLSLNIRFHRTAPAESAPN